MSGHEPPAGAAVSPGACVGLRVEGLVTPPPGRGEPLADGVHAVHVTGIDDSTVTVDVAQWLEGPEADAAYAEDTGDTSGAPNGHHVRNASTELRTLPVHATTVSVAWRDDPTSSYWVTVSDGQVTRIVEQYRRRRRPTLVLRSSIRRRRRHVRALGSDGLGRAGRCAVTLFGGQVNPAGRRGV